MAEMSDRRDGVLSTPVITRVARWGLVSWSVIGLLILLYVLYRFILLSPLRIVFPPLAVAVVLVYLLNPLVSRLEGRGVPRIWGTLLTYLVFLGLVGLGLRFLIPLLAHQVSDFAASVPELLSRAQQWARESLRGGRAARCRGVPYSDRFPGVGRHPRLGPHDACRRRGWRGRRLRSWLYLCRCRYRTAYPREASRCRPRM